MEEAVWKAALTLRPLAEAIVAVIYTQHLTYGHIREAPLALGYTGPFPQLSAPRTAKPLWPSSTCFPGSRDMLTLPRLLNLEQA